MTEYQGPRTEDQGPSTRTEDLDYQAAENTSGGRPGPRFLILLGAMVFNITGGGSGPIFFFRERPPGGLAAPERLFTSPEEIWKKSKILKIS